MDKINSLNKRLTTISDSFGGMNFFLQFLEEIREAKHHPLTAGNSYFNSSFGNIKWNKVIFKDKITLLLKIRLETNENDNIIPNKEDKQYKKVLNLVRTLKPIIFTITPNNIDDINNENKSFTVKPFDIIGEDKTVLNPIFDLIFFSSIDKVKKILLYK